MTAALVATVALGIFGAGRAAAEAPPVPDSACLNEASFRSTSGDVKASLLIINNTGATLQSFWLDYEGKRVFYSQIAPLTSYIQPTWLTHPWIVANLQGACYRFVVMNSVQQTVTVNPGDGPPSSLAAPPTAAPPTSAAASPASAAAAPSSLPRTTATNTPAVTVGTDSGSNFPTLPVVGGLVALIGLVGALAVTGHLPGLGGSSATAAAISPGSASGVPQVTFDPGTQLYYTNVGGNHVVVASQSDVQSVLDGVGNPPVGSPLYQQTVDSFLQTKVETAGSGTITLGSASGASAVTFDPASQQYYTNVGGNHVVVATQADVQSVLDGVGNPPVGSPLYQQTVDNFLKAKGSSPPPSASADNGSIDYGGVGDAASGSTGLSAEPMPASSAPVDLSLPPEAGGTPSP